MSLLLLVFALIIIICVFLNKISSKLGIPVLLFFLMLGLLFGSHDNQFADNNAWLVGDVSTIALIFIMFYGGFGTRWKSAKPIAVEAGLLATVGVFLTAAFVGLFCHYALGWDWIESFLMGAVISSTDAASVFSILRTRKLGLKNNTAPLIEVESGSNDPMSYMLTSVMLSLLGGSITAGGVIWDIVSQILFGVLFGLGIAYFATRLLKKIKFKSNGFDILLFIAIAILSYALPAIFGGNGFLSAYIVGIYLGNVEYEGKKSLVGFFDAITSLMQIIIFFLLGMLAVPTALFKALVPALLIFLFLTLVARPLSVCGVLVPFRKYPASQLALVSFVGLRGAASIVFAIMILSSQMELSNDIFSIVFCIVLISIALQGSLVPAAARVCKMTDSSEDVMTTFSDFQEKSEMSFGVIHISESSRWKGKNVSELGLPQDCLVVLVLRGDERIIPKGDTLLQCSDDVVLCTKAYQDDGTDSLMYYAVSENDALVGSKVRDYKGGEDSLLVMIQRGEQRVIPNGNTTLKSGDVMVTLNRSHAKK